MNDRLNPETPEIRPEPVEAGRFLSDNERAWVTLTDADFDAPDLSKPSEAVVVVPEPPDIMDKRAEMRGIRRDFLHTSAALFAGVLVARGAWAHRKVYGPPTQPKRR